VSTTRTKAGGWVPRQRGVCRWCSGEVPPKRFTFCSAACVHEWKLRTDPGYLREKVFERDHGVCALCGVDTVELRKHKRKLDYKARRQFEEEWGTRKHLWDADHILPVAKGGGECDLSNMRTLCVLCHRKRHRPHASRAVKRIDADKELEKVLRRDRGLCAECGTDTIQLWKDKRKLDYKARQQFEKEWGAGKQLWEVDPTSMRTLCVRCHRRQTRA
jgi:5-methylcytosine-specific restriction protein A